MSTGRLARTRGRGTRGKRMARTASRTSDEAGGRVSGAALRLRNLSPRDEAGVVHLDALHTLRRKPAYWRRVFEGFVHPGRGSHRVGLAAEQEGRLVGYLIGEVRAFEFGSEPCGWIFAVGVDPACLRRGIASRLLAGARGRFARHGVRTLRTMVRRDDVRLMSFFRSNGFVGGRFLQLEASMGDGEEGEG